MKNAIDKPRDRSITQGTIFTCAVAEDYSGCATHGLVITARCDIAHQKARAYNYLPIVSLDDWLRNDGRTILAERLQAEAMEKMEKLLKHNGFAESILTTQTPRSILNTLFPEKGSKVARSFAEHCETYESATRALRCSDAWCSLCAGASGTIAGLVKELAAQKLGGYYFLPQVDPNGVDTGFVVLFREVHLLPRSLCRAIADGIDDAFFASLCQSNPSLSGVLSIRKGDLALPIGQLRSPNIEHLMQAFSTLFARIGLEDLDASYVKALLGRQPIMQEVQQ
jgi:hypothetical protein